MLTDKEREEAILYILNYGKSVSFAESCTGGLLSSYFTDISGISAVFKGSIISYSNEIKEKILGVKLSTLTKFGAVSEQTALEMVKGVAELFETDISASITGIAGPTGGTPDKPVGTVFIALKFNEEYFVKRFNFEGNRKKIRKSSADTVIKNLETFLKTKKLKNFKKIRI